MILAIVVCFSDTMAQYAIPPRPEYHRSQLRKDVKLSTDIIANALPAAALIGTLCMKDWQGLLQGVEVAAVTAALTYGLKYTVRERRPDGADMHSFPSGHSSLSFASATYVQMRYGWKFGVPAYILSTYVAWGRVFSKKHYVWDCVAGAAIGAGSALIFTTPFAKKHKLQVAPTADVNTQSMGLYASFEF